MRPGFAEAFAKYCAAIQNAVSQKASHDQRRSLLVASRVRGVPNGPLLSRHELTPDSIIPYKGSTGRVGDFVSMG